MDDVCDALDRAIPGSTASVLDQFHVSRHGTRKHLKIAADEELSPHLCSTFRMIFAKGDEVLEKRKLKSKKIGSAKDSELMQKKSDIVGRMK